MTTLTAYEQEQLAAIEAWKNAEAGIARRAFGVIATPFEWLVDKLVPESAVHGALGAASELGQMLLSTADVLRDAQVSDLAALRGRDLSLCDRLANDAHNWAIGIATAEGSATGTLGIIGAPIDVPAILTIAMRTIHKIGLCYGYESATETEQVFCRQILAASGATTLEERAAALSVLTTLRVILVKQTWKATARRIAERQLLNGLVVLPVYELARQLAVTMVKARILTAIPVAGALVGGTANGWYIREVGWAARRSFQERWLADAGKLTPEAEDNG